MLNTYKIKIENYEGELAIFHIFGIIIITRYQRLC